MPRRRKIYNITTVKIKKPGNEFDLIDSLDDKKSNSDVWDENTSNDIWKFVREVALPKRKFPEVAINQIDKDTDEILDFIRIYLKHNRLKSKVFKGLIVGNVQSGKTANYTGLCAKLSDGIFKMIVILTSRNKQLQTQTYNRIKKDLNINKWFLLNDHNDEINLTNIHPEQVESNKYKGYLIVIKKDKNRLEEFIKLLKSEFPYNEQKSWNLTTLPTIIIDDEADDASIDINPRSDEYSTINGLIRDIINCFSSFNVFLGYTATPYANVFIDFRDLEDLFPQNLIYILKPGPGYMGLKDYFGDEPKYDYLIEQIPKNEFKTLKYLNNIEESEIKNYPIPPTLKESLIHFLIATIILRKKKSCVNCTENILEYPISTHMIVNIHQHTKIHNGISLIIDNWIQKWYNSIVNTKDSVNKIKRSFRKYYKKSFAKIISFAFDEIWNQLEFELRETIVIQENSMVDMKDRLNQKRKEKPNANLIVVGGNVISRGLTLQNLLVTYFGRASSQADTIYQMGRWFGYRKEYIELTKLYMTEDSHEHFIDQTFLDMDLRKQLERLTKKAIEQKDKNEIFEFNKFEVIPKILCTPNVIPSNRKKMRNAVKGIFNISEKRIEYSFVKDSKLYLTENKKILTKFFRKNRNSFLKQNGNLIAKDLDISLIIDFLRYFNAKNRTYPIEEILSFLDRERKSKYYKKWNFVINGGTTTTKTIKIDDVSLFLKEHEYSQKTGENEYHLKGVISIQNTLIDIPDAPKVNNVEESFEIRRKYENKPLVLITPITPELYYYTKLEGGRKDKKRIKVEDDIIHLSLIFPKNPNVSPEYWESKLQYLME